MAASPEEHIWHEVGVKTIGKSDGHPPTRPPKGSSGAKGSSQQLPMCPECGSQKIWKDGLRSTRHGDIQRYLCRSCGYRFSETQVKVNVTSQIRETFNPRENHSKTWVFSGDSTVEKIPDNLSFPFSEDIASHNTSSISTVEKDLNRLSFYNRKRRVSAKRVENLVRQLEREKAGEKPASDLKGKIVEFMWHLKKRGYAETSIRSWVYRVRKISEETDIFNSDSVNDLLARHEEWSDSYKFTIASAYKRFAEFLGLAFEPPRYKTTRKLPFIPTEREIDQLIAACGKKTAAFLQLLKETGMRCSEAWQLKWTDIDSKSKTVRVTSKKHGNPRNLKLPDKTIAMLQRLPKKSMRVFHSKLLSSFRGNFCRQRKRAAIKLSNPRLMQITFHTLRHWKATTEYHRTKDILRVKQMLGHKSIESTMIYTHLIDFESNEYITRVTKTVKGTRALTEAGFEYVTDVDGYKLFRKPK